MKNISIKTAMALSFAGVALLSAALTFYTSNSKAQTSVGLTGSCGFVMNKNFGGLSNMNVGYDFMQNYIGVIDFDKKTFLGAGSSVSNYQQSTATVSNVTFPTINLIPDVSNFSGSYRFKLGSNEAVITVVPVNSSNTFMLMLDYGATAEPTATGVCQKI